MPAKRDRKRVNNKTGSGIFKTWLTSHARVARASATRLIATPVSSFLTVFVIAVSLLLPALLFALNDNLRTVTSEFQESARISLYLVQNISETEGLQISEDLLTNPGIRAVTFISSATALAEFSAASGLGSVLTELPSNPLPATILVTPNSLDPTVITALADTLALLPEVDLAQVDSQWLQRLAAVSRLITVIGTGLAVIVVLGLFVIVGNTIKLAIENRRTEISVIKLVGGTDSFIARPFLYSGLLFGGAGGLLAVMLQLIVLAIFNSPLQDLLSLYDSSFDLRGFSFTSTLILILAGSIIGWTAALFASYRHIRSLDP